MLSLNYNYHPSESSAFQISDQLLSNAKEPPIWMKLALFLLNKHLSSYGVPGPVPGPGRCWELLQGIEKLSKIHTDCREIITQLQKPDRLYQSNFLVVYNDTHLPRGRLWYEKQCFYIYKALNTTTQMVPIMELSLLLVLSPDVGTNVSQPRKWILATSI